MSAPDSTIKVSVIMPTFNRAKYIIESIACIQNQTYPNWELLIIDDGSEDNTEELVNQLKDGRIQYYKEIKTGIGGCIKNSGLKKASGNFIAFIDSDDVWAPSKLEKQVNALLQYPETGFCLTGGYNFKIPFEPVEYFYPQREGIKVENVFQSYFKSELPGFTQALMLRKECIGVTGMFKEVNSFSDLYFILTLAWHYKAVILFEPLLYRRLHSNSYSTDSWEKSYKEGIALIRYYNNKKMISSKTTRNSLFRLYINFGEDCLKHKENKKAVLQFINAWIYKPASIIPFKKMGKTLLRMLKKHPLD